VYLGTYARGGIFYSDGWLNTIFENVTVRELSSTYGSFFYGNNSVNFFAISCLIVRCESSEEGGAIMLSRFSGLSTVENCSFIHCTVGYRGGGIYVYLTSKFNLIHSIFINCSASSFSEGGGGICFGNSNQTDITNCSFVKCEAQRGFFFIIKKNIYFLFLDLGGGLYYIGISSSQGSHVLTNNIFVDCKSHIDGKGNDVQIDVNFNFNSANVVNSYSNSAEPKFVVVNIQKELLETLTEDECPFFSDIEECDKPCFISGSLSCVSKCLDDEVGIDMKCHKRCDGEFSSETINKDGYCKSECEIINIHECGLLCESVNGIKISSEETCIGLNTEISEDKDYHCVWIKETEGTYSYMFN
jgi:hypothetical protein